MRHSLEWCAIALKAVSNSQAFSIEKEKYYIIIKYKETLFKRLQKKTEAKELPIWKKYD